MRWFRKPAPPEEKVPVFKQVGYAHIGTIPRTVRFDVSEMFFRGGRWIIELVTEHPVDFNGYADIRFFSPDNRQVFVLPKHMINGGARLVTAPGSTCHLTIPLDISNVQWTNPQLTSNTVVTTPHGVTGLPVPTGPTSGPPQNTSKVWTTGPAKPLTPQQQQALNAIQQASQHAVKVALYKDKDHPAQERNFKDALIGHKVYTYENVDGSPVAGEYGWVSDLDYWDDRDGEVVLRRKRWLLLADEEITLPDPLAHLRDDDDE